MRQRYRSLVAAVRAFALILLLAEPARAGEEATGPFDELELFEVAGAVGTLVLPAGAPDRRTPAIMILHGNAQPDSRASLDTDKLLDAGFAVLEVVHLPGGSLQAVLTALALHPRVAGQPLGLLGFSAGARLGAEGHGLTGARALLYTGCEGVAPAVTPGEAVVIIHGAAHPANVTGACAMLGQAMGASCVAVRLSDFEGASYARDQSEFTGEGDGVPLLRHEGGAFRGRAALPPCPDP